MEERLRLVARLLDGEGMSEVCRSFGISRKTGYKIYNRYKQHGLEALSDRSRRPEYYANQLPAPLGQLIVRLKREKPHWGARKIRELLVRRLAGDVRIPAKSTVHAVLDRHGLVERALQRRRHKARGTPLSRATAPKCAVVRRFQGQVQARQWPVLLPPHRHRLGLALPAAVRSLGIDQGSWRLRGFPAGVRRARPAGRHPLRQRSAIRQPQRSVQPLQAGGLVAAAEHRHRAHPARPATAERAP